MMQHVNKPPDGKLVMGDVHVSYCLVSAPVLHEVVNSGRRQAVMLTIQLLQYAEMVPLGDIVNFVSHYESFKFP